LRSRSLRANAGALRRGAMSYQRLLEADGRLLAVLEERLAAAAAARGGGRADAGHTQRQSLEPDLSGSACWEGLGTAAARGGGRPDAGHTQRQGLELDVSGSALWEGLGTAAARGGGRADAGHTQRQGLEPDLSGSALWEGLGTAAARGGGRADAGHAPRQGLEPDPFGSPICRAREPPEESPRSFASSLPLPTASGGGSAGAQVRRGAHAAGHLQEAQGMLAHGRRLRSAERASGEAERFTECTHGEAESARRRWEQASERAEGAHGEQQWRARERAQRALEGQEAVVAEALARKVRALEGALHGVAGAREALAAPPVEGAGAAVGWLTAEARALRALAGADARTVVGGCPQPPSEPREAQRLQDLLARVFGRQAEFAARACWGAWRRLSRERGHMQGLLLLAVRCQGRRAARWCWGAWGVVSREAQWRRKLQERVAEHHGKAARRAFLATFWAAWFSLPRDGGRRHMLGLLAHAIRCQERRAARWCWGAWVVVSREAQWRRKQQERVAKHHGKAVRRAFLATFWAAWSGLPRDGQLWQERHRVMNLVLVGSSLDRDKISRKEQEVLWRCWRWVVEGRRRREAYLVQSSRWQLCGFALRCWLLWSVPTRARRQLRHQGLAGPRLAFCGEPTGEGWQAAGQQVWASGAKRRPSGALGPSGAREGQAPQLGPAPEGGLRAPSEEALAQDRLLVAEEAPLAPCRAAHSRGRPHLDAALPESRRLPASSHPEWRRTSVCSGGWQSAGIAGPVPPALASSAWSLGAVPAGPEPAPRPAAPSTEGAGAEAVGAAADSTAIAPADPSLGRAAVPGGRAKPGRPALTVVWPAWGRQGGGSTAQSPHPAAAVKHRQGGSPA
ncbi:unnamed protein product, partial [Prorocentrum cordatum]